MRKQNKIKGEEGKYTVTDDSTKDVSTAEYLGSEYILFCLWALHIDAGPELLPGEIGMHLSMDSRPWWGRILLVAR